MNVNGSPKEFIIVHNGNPDTSIYDESCTGTWLLMKDLYVIMMWKSSLNVYADSDIHVYLNDEFLGLFDSDVRSAIKQVKIPYWNGTGSGGSLATGSNGLSTKIFLLCTDEVGLITEDGTNMPINGACLNYFNDTSETDSKRIGYYGETAEYWWLRSPNTFGTRGAWCIHPEGRKYSWNCTTSRGVRPALILPSTVLVDSFQNIIT